MADVTQEQIEGTAERLIEEDVFAEVVSSNDEQGLYDDNDEGVDPDTDWTPNSDPYPNEEPEVEWNPDFDQNWGPEKNVLEFLSDYQDPETPQEAIDLGWGDWFCKETALPRKTRSLVQRLRKLVKTSPYLDLTTVGVKFGNRQPMKGSMYDTFSLVDLVTGDPVVVVVPRREYKEYASGQGMLPLYTESELTWWSDSEGNMVRADAEDATQKSIRSTEKGAWMTIVKWFQGRQDGDEVFDET